MLAQASTARGSAYTNSGAVDEAGDCSHTAEGGAAPVGDTQGANSGAAAPAFVVHKHAARQLHYSFRLEPEGVLKSWAIVKGPSLGPAGRRMAIHVDDHPLEYRHFEGIIPAGQYCAGEVIIWERGHWQPLSDPRQAYSDGKLPFRLHWSKLHGEWALVRMLDRAKRGREPWLLIKKSDEAASPTQQHDVVAAEPTACCSRLTPAPGRLMRRWPQRAPGLRCGTPFAHKRAPPHEVGRRADDHT